MVEIEEMPPEEEPPKKEDVDVPPTDQGNNTSTTTDGDGWEKLMGDDLVLKIIEKSEPAGGKGPEAINPQDAVLIDFVGRIAEDKSQTDGPIFQQAKGWLVVVGEGDVLPCLEMAIRFMETGQTGRVWAHSKYAFGTGSRSYMDGKERKEIPPNASVMFEIKVLMIVMDTSRLNPYFTIQKATTRKSIANDIYQNEWCPPPQSPNDPSCETAMSRAIRLYTKAAKEMETLLQGTYFQQVEADHPQRHQTQQLLMDCLNNIVAVYLRQHEYHKAKQAAIEVLKHDNKNIKGLLRAAKASLLDTASTLEEVQAALKAAEGEITYKNPEEEKQLKQLKAQFKRKQHEYKERSKAMFGDKLQKPNALSSKKDEDATNNDNEEGKTTAETDNAATTSAAGEETAESQETEDTTNPGMKRNRVSFDEATTKPPSPQGTEEATAKIQEFNFWKQQIISMVFQVVVPLGLYFLYRLVTKANRIGESTLAANDARSMSKVVEDPDTIEFD